MARARCPVLSVFGPDAQPNRAAEQAVGAQLRAQDRWRAWRRGKRSRWDAAALVPEPPPKPAAVLAQWTPHKVLGAGKRAFCLVCGTMPTTADKGRLLGTPCAGLKRLRAAVTVRLTSGEHDAELATRPSLRETAEAQGWKRP